MEHLGRLRSWTLRAYPLIILWVSVTKLQIVVTNRLTQTGVPLHFKGDGFTKSEISNRLLNHSLDVRRLLRDLHSLKLTHRSENRSSQQKKQSSKHPFSGANYQIDQIVSFREDTR